MATIFEKMIFDFNNKVKDNKKRFSSYFKEVKNKSNNLTRYSKIKIEIKKCEFELKQMYKNIGEYISHYYKSDKVLDFTYDEKYKKLIKEIEKLKIYIEDLEKKI